MMGNRNGKLLIGALLLLCSCGLEPGPDNAPKIDTGLNSGSLEDIQVLVTGLEAQQRHYMGAATQMFGSFGREIWLFFKSDERYLTHWLGIEVPDTYPDFFASQGSFVDPYLAVRDADVLIQTATESFALNVEQKAGVLGFAKTIKAFQLSWPWLQQWDNGIRVDVSDPENLGPVLPRLLALEGIRDILNEGYEDLQEAGEGFVFSLTIGFDNFDTPESFSKVNRAIAARLALYAEDWQVAQEALNASFLDLQIATASASKMNMGPAHVYGTEPDLPNPLYFDFDQAAQELLICHPAWIEEALPNDKRLKKVIRRIDHPLQISGFQDADGNTFQGEFQDQRWPSEVAAIPFIRNEELILIYAEVQLRTNELQGAVDAINIIRNTWGLGNYEGGRSPDELLEEILFQRRYSLWAEGGHRWIDLRRTGRLDARYVDLRDGGVLFQQVSAPTSVVPWEGE